MGIFKGINNVKKIYYGNNKIGKVYYGSNLVYLSTVNFLTCSWNDIKIRCDLLENGRITTAQFCSLFTNGSTPITSMSGFVGLERSVVVNGQTHTVRVIGTQHDVDANNVSLALSFEFKNLISDSNGNSLGLVWNDTVSSGSANQDYINSSIRKALCGNGNFATNVLYARKGATSWASEYTNRTILSMLPSDLQAVLKTVKKTVGIGSSYTETSYTDKLFMLSCIEMGFIISTDKGFGSTYSYYSGHTEQIDVIRIKKQVNNSEVYTSSSQIPSGSGQAYQGTIYNYSGYNYKLDSSGGGTYFYRSPTSYGSELMYVCRYEGGCDSLFGYVYNHTYGVAPCFCI